MSRVITFTDALLIDPESLDEGRPAPEKASGPDKGSVLQDYESGHEHEYFLV